jgi:hypothetical protein
LAPVNTGTIVATCNVLILSVAIQTQFQDPPKEVQVENTEVQVENSTASRRVPSYVEYLLTRPGLDSLGLESAYLPATGAVNANYTIYGTPFDGLTAAQKRHISAVFTWDSDLLYRMNQHVLTAYHLAFDLTSINDLDPTLFAFHVSQILAVLLFNRVQIAKSDMLHNASLIGSQPLQSTRHVSQLIRDINSYAKITTITSDFNQPISRFDRALVEQVLDGLQRSAHHLPEHRRTLFTRSLQRFSDRLHAGSAVRLPALLVSFAAILQPPVVRPSRSTSPAQETLVQAALLADVVPEFRTDSDLPETALYARFDNRFRTDRDRPDSRPDRGDFRTTPRSDLRRDPRPDDRRPFRPDDRPGPDFSQEFRGNARSASRPESRLAAPRDFRTPAPDDPPASPATLEDLQKSFASLQSQLDKQTRLARQAQDSFSSSRRDRTAFAADVADSGGDHQLPREIPHHAFSMENDLSFQESFHPRPLGVRTTIDSD